MTRLKRATRALYDAGDSTAPPQSSCCSRCIAGLGHDALTRSAPPTALRRGSAVRCRCIRHAAMHWGEAERAEARRWVDGWMDAQSFPRRPTRFALASPRRAALVVGNKGCTRVPGEPGGRLLTHPPAHSSGRTARRESHARQRWWEALGGMDWGKSAPELLRIAVLRAR